MDLENTKKTGLNWIQTDDLYDAAADALPFMSTFSVISRLNFTLTFATRLYQHF